MSTLHFQLGGKSPITDLLTGGGGGGGGLNVLGGICPGIVLNMTSIIIFILLNCDVQLSRCYYNNNDNNNVIIITTF